MHGGRRHRSSLATHLETVTRSSVKKSSGGIRPIHAYGVTDRVRQRLLLMAYGDRLPINENIYSARGKGGRPAAITEVVRRIDAGAKWAAVLDIKNFFGAADRGG